MIKEILVVAWLASLTEATIGTNGIKVLLRGVPMSMKLNIPVASQGVVTMYLVEMPTCSTQVNKTESSKSFRTSYSN